MVSHVVTTYRALPDNLPEGENPIVRKQLYVQGHDDQIVVTELGVQADVNNNDQAVGDEGGNVGRQDILALLAENRSLRTEVVNLNERIGQLEGTIASSIAGINRKINRIARGPARLPRAGERQDEENNGNNNCLGPYGRSNGRNGRGNQAHDGEV